MLYSDARKTTRFFPNLPRLHSREQKICKSKPKTYISNPTWPVSVVINDFFAKICSFERILWFPFLYTIVAFNGAGTPSPWQAEVMNLGTLEGTVNSKEDGQNS
jgi:hypothetical protein